MNIPMEKMKKESPGFKDFLLFGGLYWTRTSDPIDVNDVLSAGGKVCEKQMLGVHMSQTVDFTEFLRFRLHPPGVHRMGVHRVFTPF